MENNYAIILAAAILLVFLIYKEIKRANPAHLVLRLLAVTLAVTTLVLLFLPVKYQVKTGATPTTLQLLTAGANLDDLKNGVKSKDRDQQKVYLTTDSNVWVQAGAKNITYVPDLAYYLQANPELNTLTVHGYGLKPEELKRLKNYTYNFSPAPSPEGIISCSWPRVIQKTAVFNVQGIYNNTSAAPVKLMLEGLGTHLDSVTMKAHAATRFSLRYQPPQTGRSLYTLTALAGKDTLGTEKIPFQVTEPAKIKLLVLSSFPDFEYKFLKNWLFEKGYQVVFRTRISKDKFSTDRLNTSGMSVNSLSTERLNAGVLAKFDAVIADDEELSKLDPAALSALRSAINQGLGLLVRLSEEKTLSEFAKSFKVYPGNDTTVKTYTPILSAENSSLKPLPSGQLYLQEGQSQQPLVTDQNGKILSGTALYGNGKVTASLVSSTYNWILAGEVKDYALFWSALISSTVRKQAPPYNWSTNPALPVAGHQTVFIYESAAPGTAAEISINHLKLNPIQNTAVAYRWHSIFWPLQLGWNELTIQKNTAGALFVYGEKDWKSLKNQKLLEENKQYAENAVKNVENIELQSENMEKEVSKWWFFAVFLLSAGYIWFETKML